MSPSAAPTLAQLASRAAARWPSADRAVRRLLRAIRQRSAPKSPREYLKKVGRIGLKSVIYFEVLTTIALVIGLVFAFSTGIGSGANIHLEQLSAADMGDIAQRGQHMHTTTQFLMDLIPTSVIGAFADNNILQVLLFSVLFGSVSGLVQQMFPGRHLEA